MATANIKLKFTKATYRDAMGTSLKGYVKATYAKLVSKFGRPTYGSSPDNKIDVEWIMKVGPYVVTIYNYKTGPAYLGKSGTPVKQITSWNVGGNNPAVVGLVKQVLR